MSKKDKNRDVQEPWEQPIYETETEENYSRSGRRQKRGNSAFLTVVLVLLFLIIAVPTVAGFWIMNRDNKPETAQTSSSTVESTISSTTKESTTSSETQSTSSSSSSSVESSESTAPSETVPSSTTEEVPQSETPQAETPEVPTETPQDEQGAVYETVYEGEGPQQVAARAGISLEELFRLNGLDMNNYDLHPGDQLRVK